MTPPPNAPIFQHLSRPAYISGIIDAHLLKGSRLLIRFMDTESEFTTIPYDNDLVRMYAPGEIAFSTFKADTTPNEPKPIKQKSNQKTLTL